MILLQQRLRQTHLAGRKRRRRRTAVALFTATAVAAVAAGYGAFSWGMCTALDVRLGFCNPGREGHAIHWAPREGELFRNWLNRRGVTVKQWQPAHQDAANTFRPPLRPVTDVRMVADLLEDVLMAVDSPLYRYARALAEAGKRWNVNPFLVAGIAGVESGWGKVTCGYNFAGLGACGRAWHTTNCVGDVPAVSLNELTSWPASIRTTTRFIRCRFPHADTVAELSGYCAGCPTWFGAVERNMAEFGSTPGTRWSHAVMAVR